MGRIKAPLALSCKGAVPAAAFTGLRRPFFTDLVRGYFPAGAKAYMEPSSEPM